MARYHVKAWGADDLPDLDYQTDTDDYPKLSKKYPCINIALLTPITREMVDKLLGDIEKKNASPQQS